VGDCDAKVFIGIDWRVVDADFVVKMRAGGASAEAYVADGVAAVNVLAGGDGESRKMAVAGGDAVAVIHHEGFAVSAHEIGEGDDAVCRSDDGMAVVAANINAAVKCAFPVKGINALAKAAGDLAFYGPQIRERRWRGTNRRWWRCGSFPG
jgi:hypothetical protein